MKQMKQELKEIANEIKFLKPQRKTCHFKGNRTMSASEAVYKIDRLSYEYRHMHIAYCLLRGRTMEQIEQPAENNEANMILVERYKSEVLKRTEKSGKQEPKMFVIADDSLPKNVQAVQAGHALAAYLLNHVQHKWTNGTLIYLKHDSIVSKMREFEELGLRVKCFKEPDLDNKVTAISVISDNEDLFSGMSLM